MPAVNEAFPYLIVRGAARAIEFYSTVFGARETLRIPDGERVGHAELELGPITVMVADEYPELGIRSPLAFGGTGVRIHLHVDDVDSLTRRAVDAGATTLMPPTDQAHGERQSRVRDPFGHEWLLGHPIPSSSASRGTNASSRYAGPTLFPAVRFRDKRAAIDWLQRVFGFERHAVFATDDGTIAHAELKLGAGIMMLGSPPEDGAGFSVYAYVEDVDAHYERARTNGAEIVRPLADTSYGSREYGVRDLDGHLWFFGTYLPG